MEGVFPGEAGKRFRFFRRAREFLVRGRGKGPDSRNGKDRKGRSNQDAGCKSSSNKKASRGNNGAGHGHAKREQRTVSKGVERKSTPESIFRDLTLQCSDPENPEVPTVKTATKKRGWGTSAAIAASSPTVESKASIAIMPGFRGTKRTARAVPKSIPSPCTLSRPP